MVRHTALSEPRAGIRGGDRLKGIRNDGLKRLVGTRLGFAQAGHVRLDRLRKDDFIRAVPPVVSGSHAAAAARSTAAPGSIVIG